MYSRTKKMRSGNDDLAFEVADLVVAVITGCSYDDPLVATRSVLDGIDGHRRWATELVGHVNA